jgi:glycosyltransferase involved in cell wall biosynthesis
VGRLAKEKGLPLVLEAIKRLRQEGYDCYLKCIGDGPTRASLEAQVVSLALQEEVRFLGFLEGEALHRATADVTAVIMPSVCEETAGVAAMEQMMRGGLVIASDIGGLGEIVENAGFKFRAGDVNGLTNCLRRAIDRPARVIEVARKARERATKLFGQERMVEEHHKLYENLLCQETAARRWI